MTSLLNFRFIFFCLLGIAFTGIESFSFFVLFTSVIFICLLCGCLSFTGLVGSSGGCTCPRRSFGCKRGLSICWGTWRTSFRAIGRGFFILGLRSVSSTLFLSVSFFSLTVITQTEVIPILISFCSATMSICWPSNHTSAKAHNVPAVFSHIFLAFYESQFEVKLLGSTVSASLNVSQTKLSFVI